MLNEASLTTGCDRIPLALWEKAEPGFLESATRLRPLKITQESRGRGHAVLYQRRGIDNRLMCVFREDRDRADARLNPCIGGINDSERRFTARNIGERRA